MQQLSKSDFKLASGCPQKLLYKKVGYKNTNEDNEFLQILAEGGYIVGKMAQVMYTQYAQENGFLCHEITGNAAQAIADTEALLHNEKIILFEPAISIGQKIVRIDILVKDGNQFTIIEVKAKSQEGVSEGDEQSKTTQEKKLTDYIEDVAYQTHVLQDFLISRPVQFPRFFIRPRLLMPDKSRCTKVENLAGWFAITDKVQTGNFTAVEVDFLQNGNEKALWENGNSILQLLDVSEKVQEILPAIAARANNFIAHLNGYKLIDKETLISKNCFACEFKDSGSDKDGYGECLDKRAYGQNHIAEMYHCGTIGGIKTPAVNILLQKNQPLSIFNFSPDDFKNKKGEISARGQRQIIQYENTKANTEYIAAALKNELAALQYPLHFIDFETIAPAIPHHKGMRPYETVAFQWSCHTIESYGTAPVHAEWINEQTVFPNFSFAEALMQQIGDNGTPLMWATHENTVLKMILNQLENADGYLPGYRNDRLKQWLLAITKENGVRPGRLTDMNKLTLDYYFHPYMKGKTSIKKTLPAIWNHNSYLHQIAWLKEYYKNENGIVLSPYETLKDRWENTAYEQAELNETVKEGSGAMRAYHDMLFGKGKNNPAVQQRLKQELLNYCRLDTMAMVIIWQYWMDNG